MDKFVVDIDAVLDEFEQLESRDHPPDPMNSAPTQTSLDPAVRTTPVPFSAPSFVMETRSTSSEPLWYTTSLRTSSGVLVELCNGTDTKTNANNSPPHQASVAIADALVASTSLASPSLSSRHDFGDPLVASTLTNCVMVTAKEPVATTTMKATDDVLPTEKASTKTTAEIFEEVPVKINELHYEGNDVAHSPSALGEPAAEADPTTLHTDTEQPGGEDSLAVMPAIKPDDEAKVVMMPKVTEEAPITVDSSKYAETFHTQLDSVSATPQRQSTPISCPVSLGGDVPPIQSMRSTVSPTLHKKGIGKDAVAVSSENRFVTDFMGN